MIMAINLTQFCCLGGLQVSRSLSLRASSPAVVTATSLKTDKPVEWKDTNGLDKLGVVEVDPMLAPHQNHLRYRVNEYMKRRQAIEEYEGGLEAFAKGEDGCL